jgi:predicted nucleotidyltransferase
MGRVADPLVRRFRARYLARLERRYRPRLVVVFGSRARGEALVESDLDLLVVSERFRGVPFLERAWRLLAELELPFAADVLCYTPEEFARKRRELGIVSLALEEGLRLVSSAAPGARSS